MLPSDLPYGGGGLELNTCGILQFARDATVRDLKDLSRKEPGQVYNSDTVEKLYAFGHRDKASWTTFPPTTVARGWMSLIRSASQVSRSSESSTRSPSLPTSIEPFLFSSKLR